MAVATLATYPPVAWAADQDLQTEHGLPLPHPLAGNEQVDTARIGRALIILDNAVAALVSAEASDVTPAMMAEAINQAIGQALAGAVTPAAMTQAITAAVSGLAVQSAVTQQIGQAVTNLVTSTAMTQAITAAVSGLAVQSAVTQQISQAVTQAVSGLATQTALAATASVANAALHVATYKLTYTSGGGSTSQVTFATRPSGTWANHFAGATATALGAWTLTLGTDGTLSATQSWSDYVDPNASGGGGGGTA